MSHGQDGVIGEPVEIFLRAKTQELEELLATQNQLKRDTVSKVVYVVAF